MKANIFEIKCRIDNPDHIHELLTSMSADVKGTDHQIDTYFNVKEGRLKLRQGNIENTLIRYHRKEVKSIKQSNVIFQPLDSESAEGLRNILIDAYGIWKIVDKVRRIYFIENVKFHIDEVVGLGSFMEIEAIDENNHRTSAELKQQCSQYIDLLRLDKNNLMDKSYSDLVDVTS